MTSDALATALRTALGESVRGDGDTLRVRAASSAEVSALFRLAAKHGVRVAVPGGDITPGAGVVGLELDALARLRGLDGESRTLHVEGGATFGAVEAHLRATGLTLGALDADAATREPIATWLARGAVGARAHSDDPVDQLVCGLEVVLADGTALTIRPAPRRAVGPNLVPSFVGGRGCLGVIVGAHLVARNVVPHTDVVYRFATRAAAESARAWVRGRGVRPVSTALSSGDGEAMYLRVRIEGHRAIREASLATVERVALERGGVLCDPRSVSGVPVEAQSVAPPSEIVRALARALDHAGILRA